MKILVVSGFLGAGKTTFIKTLSNKIDKKIAVLENDYAAVNIDEDILKNQTDLSVWEQTEKCICCTGKSDFAMDILTISNTLNPDFLIVEPTGVGYLSKVIANIQKIEYEQISLLSPVTVVDPSAFANCIKNYGDLYRDHIKFAGTVVLSKCDLHLDSLALEETVSKIKELNPCANIIQTHYAYQGEEFWQGLFRKNLDGSVEIPPQSEDGLSEAELGTEFESLSIEDSEIPSAGRLVAFMENLIRSRYGKIVRIKGTVKCAGELLRVDFAGDKYFIEGAEESSRNCLVVIGKNLDFYSIKKRLENKKGEKIPGHGLQNLR
ncbi:GTP-binding protein [Treponema ruminis]|uniref:G3E family GTPase n=1 Tax=Treponema ruminis TaxID=744515 RepID=A0A7W8GA21_9SPIR|nr:GTP-binding protein [Treponema ruminis]MBB5226484.1 G3E family GTPase [Treponema ruminis]QSI02611.1 GTP-binding protein [Treponema ruminis]